MVLSGWVARRSNLRIQVVVVPFDAEGPGEPVPVTRTWPPSVYPDLAIGADGNLRVAWVEPVGDDTYQVVVASTAPEAREAWVAEWWEDIAALGFESLSLLGYAPFVLGWTTLPLGLVLVGTFVSHGDLRRWQVGAWLGAAVLLQLVCKRLLFPALVPLGSDPVEVALSLVPVVLGAGLMWAYWRRAEEPLLLVAYCLFAGVDAVFTLLVMLPRVLWVT